MIRSWLPLLPLLSFLASANSTQFAWDVSLVNFLDQDGNSIAEQVGIANMISSGSASDPQHGGYQGYGAIEAFRGAFWGGRSDSMSRRWIGVQYHQSVKVGSVLFQQIGQHTTESLLVQFWDAESVSWRTCQLVTGLKSSEVYQIRLDVPLQQDFVALDDLVVVKDSSSTSPWTWSLAISLYLTANDQAFLRNGCRVDPRYGLTASPGLVLMHCTPVPPVRQQQVFDDDHMERLARILAGVAST